MMRQNYDASKGFELWDRAAVAYVNLKAYVFDQGNDELGFPRAPFPVVEALKHLMAVYDPEEYRRYFAPRVVPGKQEES